MAIQVIEPPQSAPFVEGEPQIFNKTWWLFWNSMARAINAGKVVGTDGIISYADGAESIPYPQAIERLNWEKHGERISVLDFGALADLQFGDDGAITAGSASFTSASTTFERQDIGKSIWIEGAGPAGTADLLTQITAVTSSHTVRLSSGAAFTVSGASFRYGTDNLAAIQKAFDIAADSPGVQIYFPRGAYAVIGTLTVYDNLAIAGQSYTHNPFRPYETGSPSQIVGLSDVPIISHPGTTDADTLFSLHVEKLTFRGTSRSGSVGIYLGYIFGCCFRDVSFNYFGDQALHIAFGVDGTFENCFGSDTLLVRARADYAGGFQIGCSDMFMSACKCTTSVSFPGGVVTGGLFGDGHGAGIMITGGNSFIHDSFAHGSQIGWYITTTGSLTTFVNCRADLNQGEGFLVGPDSGVGQLLGCRAHANSLGTDATYSGFRIEGSGYQFRCNQVTYNGAGAGAIHNQMKYGFEIDTPNTSEPNQFSDNYFQTDACASDEYHVNAGAQEFNPIIDATVRDPIGRISHRCNGDFSIRGIDDLTGLFLKNTSTSLVGADERIWVLRPYRKSCRLEAWDDAYSAPITAILIERTGTNIDLISLLGDLIELGGDTQIASGKILQFQTTTAKVLAGSGTPESVVTAVGGSLYLDGNGAVWVKASGTGNTGWVEVNPSGTTLPVVDTTPLVKGSGDATKLVRIDADSLTTGTTRVATMPDRDLTINNVENLSATASGSLTLTNSYADITGDTITLPITGRWLITANTTFTADAVSTGVAAQLVVAGSVYGAAMQSDVIGTYSLSRTWLVTGVTAGDVAKIQAKKNGGAGVSTAYSGSSDIIAAFLG